MKQLPLPLNSNDLNTNRKDLVRTTFSHEDVCPQNARRQLERQYMMLLEETDEFNRQLVSYQGNKGEMVHSWIKYREGFSAELVQSLINKFGIQPGQTLLEPFSGSATTLLVAIANGINAVGIEILPVCHLAWEAKSHAFEYDTDELERILELIEETEPGPARHRFPHLAITDSAFPDTTENDLMFYTEWFDLLDVSVEAKVLLRLVLTSILEEVSFTRKDGQYLRWDSRSDKVRQRNRERAWQGKRLIKGMDKGDLPTVKDALIRALSTIVDDVKELQLASRTKGQATLFKGSALQILPTLESNQFAGVITSPPYCNRYDYTRTYALELAYLKVDEEEIRELRQSQLSCTVEHRSKVEQLRDYYASIDASDRFERTLDIVLSNPVFQEVNEALRIRWERGEINNRGILSMVEGYFIELAFVFAEVLRTCQPGAHVAFVNDNVRYGGEVIPVDLLTTHLAEQLGYEPQIVYVLPNRKGNSSQQMKRFGREALRKSITIWKKPD